MTTLEGLHCDYMPHHGVIRTDQKTIKLRVVYYLRILMISIDPSNRNMLRFLSLKDPKELCTEILEMRFCRLVFGLRPSPAILGVTKRSLYKITAKLYDPLVLP